jgi:hypothetical protein
VAVTVSKISLRRKITIYNRTPEQLYRLDIAPKTIELHSLSVLLLL